MAHKEQFQFVRKLKNKYSAYFTKQNVIEYGALNINGSVRDLFIISDFTGIDLSAGPNINWVGNGKDYDGPAANVTFSCECFEHNPDWIETFQNMIDHTISGGLVFMTCATTGRAEHGTSITTPGDSPFTIASGWEYYQNLTEADFRKNFKLSEIFSTHSFEVNTTSKDLYFHGIKK